MKKQLIINWKWTELEDHELNQDLLEKNPYLRKKYSHIEQVNGLLYKIYPVEEESNSSIHANIDQVITVNINNGDLSKEVLENVVNHFTDQDTCTYLFLHRGHNFGYEEVKYFLTSNLNIHRCFLFHGRNDFLYYSTFNDGLLDNSGGFYVRPKKGVSVLNEDSTAVKKRFFDRVWAYYTNELEHKLFELRHHFIQAYLPLLKNDQITYRELHSILNQPSTLLQLRFESMLGYYNDLDPYASKDKEKREKRELLELLERKQGQSYTLDDWRVNIAFEENKEHIEQALDNLCQLLQELLNQTFEEVKLKEVLQEVVEGMEHLIKLLNGEINY